MRGPANKYGAEVADRFWSRVDQSGGTEACWPWTGARYDTGYGAVRFNQRNHGTHRVAFTLSQGREPANGLHILHSCDNKPCCNPAHLSEGTRSQNMREAWDRGRLTLTRRTGAAHPQSTLTDAQVCAIRRLREGGAKVRDIAEAVGISLGAISNIVSRRTWKDVA